MTNIPSEVRETICFVASYVVNTDDWLTIKKEIIKNLKPLHRSLFSTRDPVTKRQVLNEFDVQIAVIWKNITGVSPILRQSGNETTVIT